MITPDHLGALHLEALREARQDAALPLRRLRDQHQQDHETPTDQEEHQS